MIELPFVFMAGILGTAHCLGMCGPIILAIGGSATTWSAALLRQAVYTLGRLFTYGVLGAVAGYCGIQITRSPLPWVNLPAVLALAAGLFLIYQGLNAAGLLQRFKFLFRKSANSPSALPCLAGGLMGQFLRQPGTSGVFLAGLITGLLPCGLLYGMLALAVSSHSILGGASIMLMFGAGTAPLLMLAGLGGGLLGIAARRRLYTVAAWCLIFVGVLSVARGVSHFSGNTGGCPCCVPPVTERVD